MPRITAEQVTIRAGNPPLQGYLARPAGPPASCPAVVVVHENRGLNPHIQDIARRLATDGFMALAVDFLSPRAARPRTRTRRAT